MNNIELRDVKWYEWLYYINTLWQVFNKNKKHLKPLLVNGYHKVTLYKDWKWTQTSIHRILAHAFIENPNDYKIINHKDWNRSNNNINNIEWCTHSYNSLHWYRSNWRVITDKHRIKASQQWIKNWKKVKQLTIEWDLLNIFRSCKQACKILWFKSNSRISRCARGLEKKYMWYKREYEL